MSSKKKFNRDTKTKSRLVIYAYKSSAYSDYDWAQEKLSQPLL